MIFSRARLLLALLTSALCTSSVSAAAELWVAPAGDDTAPGTREQPLASVATALRKARDLRRTSRTEIEGGVSITLRGGVYSIADTLRIRPEDSGSTASPTILRNAPGEAPVLSGGTPVTGWRKLTEDIPGLPAAARGQVWVAPVPVFHGRPLEIRHLWVNNAKAPRARTPDAGSMDRLLAWDRAQCVASIPAHALQSVKPRRGLEMVLLQMWEIAILRIQTVETSAAGVARVSFFQPEAKVQSEHPWPQPSMKEGNAAPYYLTGLIEFLDSPGEWVHEPGAGRLYYWPRAGEDLANAHIVAPRLETLLELYGSADRPVSHVQVEGISFRHTDWRRPGTEGHVPLQAGMAMIEAYKLKPAGTPDWHKLDNQAWLRRMPAAVTATGVAKIAFTGCTFESLAASGLDLVTAAHDSLIEGCLLRDIGGNAIQAGHFQDGPDETHLPHEPSDERQLCTRVRIANNRITDAANEDWGCVAIGIGYARAFTIEHNDIADVSYSGVSLGWGWTRTANCQRDHRVRANRFSRIATRMADTAAIYTLSSQPGTIISENVVGEITMSPYVHDPEHWFYLYLDEGSSHIVVRDNFCPAEKFLKNANGPGNEWSNNGPQVSPAIQSAAGLEPKFQHLLTR